jgi:CheY-like chemotaxis protein
MSKRILVVEDQPDNRQIIRGMLAGTDYEITEAEDGEQAIAAVAKQRPDLILMGVQLQAYACRASGSSGTSRTSVSTISVTATGRSITSTVAVSTANATGCFTFRAPFFTGARLGLVFATERFVSFAALATLRALPRLADFPLGSFPRFCTFDPFLRLAMIVPWSGLVLRNALMSDLQVPATKQSSYHQIVL